MSADYEALTQATIEDRSHGFVASAPQDRCIGFQVQKLGQLLSQAQYELRANATINAFQRLGPQLTKLWRSADSAEIKNSLVDQARSHPIFSIIQEDPYSRRAFLKPRGYAGDAATLDYVYSGIAPPGTSVLGTRVFNRTTRGPMGLSVLYRKDLLRAYINHCVSTSYRYRILSVASGHCREIAGSIFSEEPTRGEFIAIDQDEECCRFVNSEFPFPQVTPRTLGVKAIVFGNAELGKFDLIYAAGLLDYLPARLARGLVESLLNRLNTNGRLVIGNYMPSSRGVGFMELFLDWKLIYRSEEELRSLFGDCRDSVRTFTDPHQNVAYAEATLS